MNHNKTLNKKLDKFSLKGGRYIGYLLKIGLIIYLSLNFRRGDIELSFWLMAISLALAGILINKEKKLQEISTDFIYATIFFTTAVASGGIQKIFGGEGISPYHIFITGHYNLELILTGISFAAFGITFLGILWGSMYFIDGIMNLFFYISKKDKRPIKIF